MKQEFVYYALQLFKYFDVSIKNNQNLSAGKEDLAWSSIVDKKSMGIILEQGKHTWRPRYAIDKIN